MKRFLSLFVVALVLSFPFSFAYSLTYDANGNPISGDGFFRVYDTSNHLVNVYSGSSLVNTNLLENYTWFSPEDRVFAKFVYFNGTLNQTVYYPREDWVRVKNSSGTFDFMYVVQNGEIVVMKDFNGKQFYYHNDHKGSPQVVTDINGNVVEQTFYEPFGAITLGGSSSRFDYEGKEYDSVTSDYDFAARRYDPTAGMFTTPDTIIQNVYDPQSLNHYSFEKNSPYMNKDGHKVELVLREMDFFYSRYCCLYS